MLDINRGLYCRRIERVLWFISAHGANETKTRHDKKSANCGSRRHQGRKTNHAQELGSWQLVHRCRRRPPPQLRSQPYRDTVSKIGRASVLKKWHAWGMDRSQLVELIILPMVGQSLLSLLAFGKIGREQNPCACAWTCTSSYSVVAELWHLRKSWAASSLICKNLTCSRINLFSINKKILVDHMVSGRLCTTFSPWCWYMVAMDCAGASCFLSSSSPDHWWWRALQFPVCAALVVCFSEFFFSL